LLFDEEQAITGCGHPVVGLGITQQAKACGTSGSPTGFYLWLKSKGAMHNEFIKKTKSRGAVGSFKSYFNYP
jgi:hypothetical protein